MNSENEQFYRVLKKHYLLKMSQKEVAKDEGLSAATVSWMVNCAIGEGYVKFQLNLPGLSLFELEEEIKSRFQLDIVSVSKVDLEDPEVIERDVAIAAANYLNAVLKPGDIMGAAWGNTLAELQRTTVVKARCSRCCRSLIIQRWRKCCVKNPRFRKYLN